MGALFHGHHRLEAAVRDVRDKSATNPKGLRRAVFGLISAFFAPPIPL